jgi:acetyl esterase/lipase
MTDMPESIRQIIAEIGPAFDPSVLGRVRALYAPLMQDASEVEAEYDLPYGPDPRQQIDVYTRFRRGAAPVVIYVPGGGFNGGDKRSDDTFYGNVGRWFGRNGAVCVIANYRLAPDHPWPAGAEDVRAVLAWTRRAIANYGGDPERVFLFGQSAGATHAATCVFDPTIRDPQNQPVGAILASGLYRMTTDHKAPNVVGYFGADPARYEARSPINHAATSKVPLFLSIAEFDPIGLAMPTLELAQAVARRDGKVPRFLYQRCHNHVSTVLCFNTGDETFGRAIIEFMADCEGR